MCEHHRHLTATECSHFGPTPASLATSQSTVVFRFLCLGLVFLTYCCFPVCNWKTEKKRDAFLLWGPLGKLASISLLLPAVSCICKHFVQVSDLSKKKLCRYGKLWLDNQNYLDYKQGCKYPPWTILYVGVSNQKRRKDFCVREPTIFIAHLICPVELTEINLTFWLVGNSGQESQNSSHYWYVFTVPSCPEKENKNETNCYKSIVCLLWKL